MMDTFAQLLILTLAAGAYAFKALGFFGLSRLPLHGWTLSVVQLLPAALFAALVTVQIFGFGDTSVVLTRFAGVAVGAIAVWRRAPLVVVLLAAAATTAGLRATLP